MREATLEEEVGKKVPINYCSAALNVMGHKKEQKRKPIPVAAVEVHRFLRLFKLSKNSNFFSYQKIGQIEWQFELLIKV